MIKSNFKGVSVFESEQQFPTATYKFQVVKADATTSQKGNEAIKVRLKAIATLSDEVEANALVKAGATKTQTMVTNGDGSFRYAAFLMAMGYDRADIEDNADFTADEADFPGNEVWAYVAADTTPEGKDSNKFSFHFEDSAARDEEQYKAKAGIKAANGGARRQVAETAKEIPAETTKPVAVKRPAPRQVAQRAE